LTGTQQVAGIKYKQACTKLRVECLSFDLAEVKPAVRTHKVDDFIELLIDESAVVGDYRDSNDSTAFVILMVNLSDGDIESAFEPAD
jgi:hypothetical protein